MWIYYCRLNTNPLYLKLIENLWKVPNVKDFLLFSSVGDENQFLIFYESDNTYSVVPKKSIIQGDLKLGSTVKVKDGPSCYIGHIMNIGKYCYVMNESCMHFMGFMLYIGLYIYILPLEVYLKIALCIDINFFISVALSCFPAPQEELEKVAEIRNRSSPGQYNKYWINIARSRLIWMNMQWTSCCSIKLSWIKKERFYSWSAYSIHPI